MPTLSLSGFLPQDITYGANIAVLWLFIGTNLVLCVAWLREIWLLRALGKERFAREMFRWIRPLVWTAYGYFLLSAARSLTSTIVLWLPIQPLQTLVFFAGAIFTCAVVGLSEVHLRRAPNYAERLARHRLDANRFRVIADAAPDGIIEIDAESNVWYHNRAADEMFGYRHEEFPISAFDLLPESLRPLHAEKMAHFVAGTGKHSRRAVTVPCLNSAGREIELSVSFCEYQIGSTRRYAAILRTLPA